MTTYDRQTLERKLRGGLYGQALGDAFAMPALFRMEQTRAAYGTPGDQLLPAPPDHPVHHGMIAGRFTDDTEQAFALADAIIRDGEMTVRGAADAIVAWYDRIDGDHSPYVGPSTRRGVEALKRGADPEHAGARGDTNGSAMRVSVIGLINPGDVSGAIREAIHSAIPTHGTQTGISGACAIAAAVAQAYTATSVDELVEAGLRGASEGDQFGTRWLAPSLVRRIGMALQIARSDAPEWDRLSEIYDTVGTGLAIVESVAAAFGVLVMSGGDPIRAAQLSFTLSGDADTIGAMACAIAGTYRGIDAIPPGMIETLRRANPDYDFDATIAGLMNLAAKRAGGKR
jgi:ADP-ribosylglycohydrolase